MKDEHYELEIGPEGLSYDLLDKAFNETTQAFILKAGIKSGMRILDVGCGGGVMTAWLARQVGPNGRVMAIDNSPEQIEFARQRLLKHQLTNVDFQVVSAYDIAKLDQKFDLIYCRFVLHHVYSPRKTIKIFYLQTYYLKIIVFCHMFVLILCLLIPNLYSLNKCKTNNKQSNQLLNRSIIKMNNI